MKISTQTSEAPIIGVKVGRKKIRRKKRLPQRRLEIQTAMPTDITMFSTRYSAV